MMTTTSKSLDGVQELTLVATIKTGIVPCTGMPPSYASRLRLLLSALFTQRKQEMEVEQQGAGLLETLSVLRFVRWALLENDTKLMLAVEFDGPWEPYIRQIVTEAGPILDVIFCHCEGYAGNSCQDGYEKFAAWVRERQVEVPFIYASDPELTVNDMRFLKSQERALAAGKSLFAQGAVVNPESSEPLTRLYALFELRQFFPNDGAATRTSGATRPITDQEYFDRVSGLIVSTDREHLDAYAKRLAEVIAETGAKLGLHDAALGMWAESLKAQLLAFQDLQKPNIPERKLQNPQTVQGNILSSYSVDKTTHGCFALVRFKTAQSGAAFLARIAPQITSEASPKREADVKLNLALTFQGLRTLGLSEKELARFPREFQEGLEARAGLLGDIGLNHPEHWQLPKYNWREGNGDPVSLGLVDAVLMLQTRDTDTDGPELLSVLRARLERLEAEAPSAQPEFEILHVQPTRRYGNDDKGHLGAVDGVSQPVFAEPGKVPKPFADRDRVPLGELLLGYENQTNELGALPPELRDNSTFLAIRKMTQEHEMYELLRAQKKLELALGRAESGANLINGELSNDFVYGPNSDVQCPLFSHVRRANPRTPAPHAPRRILRRGMSFGPPYSAETAKVERGVMFLAFAASLADQYEVVQRWVNGGNSTGGFSANPDLIAGTYKPGTERSLQYRTESGVESIPLPPRPAAVLRWGVYAFVPSTVALRSLAGYTQGKYLPAAAATPERPVTPEAQFGAPALSARGMETKARLEDIFKAQEINTHIANVLAQGGISQEPDYAVMAVAKPIVQEILTHPNDYSVRSYWGRMKACRSTMYLGMDRNPAPLGAKDPCPAFTEDVKPDSYDNESKSANAFIWAIGFDEAYEAAHDAAFKWFLEQEVTYLTARKRFEKPIRPTPVLDLQALAGRVVRDVAVKLYGIPETLLSDDPDLELPSSPGADSPPASPAVRCPVDLTNVFAHVFPPRPSRTVSVEAVVSGQSIHAKVKAWYENHPDEVKKSRLIQKIRLPPSPRDADFEQRTVVGLLSGFAVPTNGSLVSVLTQLVQTEELWRLQRTLHDIDLDHADAAQRREKLAPISQRILALMIKGPVPAMIHRTAMHPTSFKTGGAAEAEREIKLEPGDLVALHLGGAAADAANENVKDPWKFLFGDVPAAEFDKARPPLHRCPGQEMALGVIHGALVALLSQRSLKKTAAPLILTRYE